MAAVKGKGNKTTERSLRLALVRAGIRGWTMHPPDISGKPDFYFAVNRLAVFVDGCFWHGCGKCGHIPKTNSQFWRAKIERNRQRDIATSRRLKAIGIRVQRVWEHDLQHSLARCVRNVVNAMCDSGRGQTPSLDSDEPLRRRNAPHPAQPQGGLSSWARPIKPRRVVHPTRGREDWRFRRWERGWRARFQGVRASLGRMRASLGRMRASLGRMRAGLGRMRASLGRMRAGLGRMRAGLGQMRAGLGRMRAGLGRMRAGLGWMRASLGRMRAGLGRMRAGLGWMRASLGWVGRGKGIWKSVERGTGWNHR